MLEREIQDQVISMNIVRKDFGEVIGFQEQILKNSLSIEAILIFVEISFLRAVECLY